MSVGAILGGIAAEVAKEAFEWAVKKVKARATEKLGKVVGESLDPKVLEALLTAELLVLNKSLERVVDEFDAAEARGKAKPLGGDAIEWIERCSCEAPTFVDGLCGQCGKVQ